MARAPADHPARTKLRTRYRTPREAGDRRNRAQNAARRPVGAPRSRESASYESARKCRRGESCLIQDEPGEGGGFSYKMSLEERSRMLGLDHQRAHIGTLEPGAHSGLFRRQWRGRIQGTESGGGLRLGESDATAATV